jgi:nicotinamidase-related amidase
MSSEVMRDPISDHLLTPQNAALVIIDYQPSQISAAKSMEEQPLIENIVRVARTAVIFDLPIVLSTVGVATGGTQPTIPQLRDVLPGVRELDRSTMNAWEDVEFNHAVCATGRKNLIMTALWTEICLTFPSLDALREGYGVFPVVDAVAGTSVEAHRAALERLVQAGAQPISWVSLAGELQRDWARTTTIGPIAEMVVSAGTRG